jgi:hypothetical protein
MKRSFVALEDSKNEMVSTERELSLHDFPDEMLVAILGELPLEWRACFHLTCRRFHHLTPEYERPFLVRHAAFSLRHEGRLLGAMELVAFVWAPFIKDWLNIPLAHDESFWSLDEDPAADPCRANDTLAQLLRVESRNRIWEDHPFACSACPPESWLADRAQRRKMEDMHLIVKQDLLSILAPR